MAGVRKVCGLVDWCPWWCSGLSLWSRWWRYHKPIISVCQIFLRFFLRQALLCLAAVFSPVQLKLPIYIVRCSQSEYGAVMKGKPKLGSHANSFKSPYDFESLLWFSELVEEAAGVMTKFVMCTLASLELNAIHQPARTFLRAGRGGR